MSFKSIELQVALPRTADAGKIQENLAKEGQRFQENLAQSQIQQEIKKRTTVNEFDKLGKTKINDDDSADQSKPDQETDHHHATADSALEHPYLGSKIDFSG